MKKVLPKIILLTLALGALIALIAVMLKNKETVKTKSKAVADKLRAKRKSAEAVAEDVYDCCCDEVECDCECGEEVEAETDADAPEAPLADEAGCECGDAE